MPRGAAGVPRPPEDLVLAPADALAEAQRLLDSGRPFHAHEILEGAWKAAPPAERDLWQGLAQIAVGLTHLQRGNLRGAATLLRRGAARITPYAGAPPYGIDVGGVLGYVDQLATEVEAGRQPTSPEPPRLLLEEGQDTLR